ncbi:hypothetical protein [Azospirillum sp. TSO5]|uniref:hypothetical protein n=1 Tax=Azospirillum sp. TSO5 TaxID=716760 RepID=UPI0011B27590|nr:hypothetical protein [Azospirillum sp. TSO5]
MECPECGCEMDHHDSYGLFAAHQSGAKHGDIFKCPDCCERGDDCTWHNTVSRPDDLRPGYPC